jgi:hypothetical protein
MSTRLPTRLKAIPMPTPSITPVRGEVLQRCPANRPEPVTVPPIVHEVLRSPGQPLDTATRAFMEPRFAHDFGHVRVHTETLATQSAQAVYGGLG